MAKAEAKSLIPADSGVVKTSNRLPVSNAYLHAAVTLPEGGGTETHFGKPTHRITMELGPEGLWIMQVGKPTTIVPHANVKSVVLK